MLDEYGPLTKYGISFILAAALDTRLTVEWSDKDSLTITCDASRVYPEPRIRLFVQGDMNKSSRYVTYYKWRLIEM